MNVSTLHKSRNSCSRNDGLRNISKEKYFCRMFVLLPLVYMIHRMRYQCDTCFTFKLDLQRSDLQYSGSHRCHQFPKYRFLPH